MTKKKAPKNNHSTDYPHDNNAFANVHADSLVTHVLLPSLDNDVACLGHIDKLEQIQYKTLQYGIFKPIFITLT